MDPEPLLIEALERLYDFAVDDERRAISERLSQDDAALAGRIAPFAQADQPLASRDFPEDRMYR